MEDAGEFDSLHIWIDDASRGSRDGGRSRAGGLPSAFECQPGALRIDVHGDVRDSGGGRDGTPKIAATMAEVGFDGWLLRVVLQFGGFGVSVRGRGEDVGVLRKDCGDGGGEQCNRDYFLYAAAPASERVSLGVSADFHICTISTAGICAGVIDCKAGRSYKQGAQAFRATEPWTASKVKAWRAGQGADGPRASTKFGWARHHGWTPGVVCW